jgi:hypothetical protein
MTDQVEIAVERLNDLTGRESELWRPVLEVIPVDGAAISTIADFLGQQTVSASNPIAARLDELQFDLGEGPCWDAMHLRRPVYETDVRAARRPEWPAFSRAILDHEVGAIYAFPLLFGPLQLGAMDLYSGHPGDLSADSRERGGILASAISATLSH